MIELRTKHGLKVLRVARCFCTAEDRVQVPIGPRKGRHWHGKLS